MQDRRKNIEHEADEDGADTFEKIRRPEKPLLPTGNDRRARRSSKETPSSKKVRKTISGKGGMHRRRQKKVL